MEITGHWNKGVEKISVVPGSNNQNQIKVYVPRMKATLTFERTESAGATQVVEVPELQEFDAGETPIPPENRGPEFTNSLAAALRVAKEELEKKS